MDKVKVLFLASNPLEQSRLALDEEIRIITARIRSTGENGVERRSDWRGVKGAPFVYVCFRRGRDRAHRLCDLGVRAGPLSSLVGC